MNLHGIALIVFLLLTPSAALAEGARLQQEDSVEPRLKTIALQLRCPVGKGESSYDFQSTVATKRRSLIREKISEGKPDSEILDFFVNRYGDFVLMEPRKSGAMLLIWLFPAVALFAGSAVAAMIILKRKQTRTEPASAAGLDTDELIRRIERLEP